jgi:hypothetical protein
MPDNRHREGQKEVKTRAESYAASLGIARSTNRKNRVLRAPDLNLSTRKLCRRGDRVPPKQPTPPTVPFEVDLDP